MRAGPSDTCDLRSIASASPAYHLEPAGVALRDFAECCDGAVVALDRDHLARAFGEQRAGEAAGSGPDLDHGDAVERARGAGDPAGEVEVEQEVLAERALGGERMAGDHLTQRRQVIGLAAHL